ncbi:MAG: hypothetical protein ABEK04_01445 [Candidatus Nanohalobium sp.]
MAVTNYADMDEKYDEELNVVIGPDEARLVEGSREEIRENYSDEYSLIGDRKEETDTFEYERSFSTPSDLEEATAHVVAGSITTGFMALEAAGQTAFSTLEAIAKALD